ncbi:MAG: energy-coupling factor transporter ATPase, partial [Oscillospiraceae bacterium]|nr:energy-coupling factor transporter ATPase [Oscillospiraceae bacterium]
KMNATVIMVSHSMEEIAETVDRLYVMRKGTIAMSGTPQEVFERAEELQPMGLAVPQITEVFTALRARGAKVPNVYTVEQAVRAISEMKGGAGSC